MRKIILFLIFLTLLCAKTYVPIKLDVNQNIYIENPKWNKNKGGFLVKQLKNGQDYLYAAFYIKAIKEEDAKTIAILNIKPLDALKQNSLPTVESQSKNGDLALFDAYETRALFLTYSQQAYLEFVRQNTNIDFTHPDLLAYEMTEHGNAVPTIEDVRRVCENFYLGNIFVHIGSCVFKVDCVSLKPIAQQKFEHFKDEQLPFYNRFEYRKTQIFDQSKVENYGDFYKKLFSIGTLNVK